MVRSRDSEPVPETRGAPVDRQRQILIRHYNRTGHMTIIESATTTSGFLTQSFTDYKLSL